MNENSSYRAMATDPWNILEFWNGKWLFSGCFRTEQEARVFFGRVNTRQLLRNGTNVVERFN